jgi:tripartite-type tricarboxylate transporter receptor subunit TctC
MNRFLLLLTAVALAILPLSQVAAADSYPSASVTIIVPFPAGGVADTLPRLVGSELAAMWHQSVIVQNKPGAGGNIGMELGTRQPANGLTLVLAPAGNMTVTPLLYRHLDFDVTKDYTPVTIIANSPNVLVINPSVPANNFKELVAYAKQNPGKLNFASPGAGSGAHLAGELLNAEAGLEVTHIPYNGISPALTDLIGGRVQIMFAGISTVLAEIKAGRLKAIAIAGPSRSALLPEVPTVAESGLAGFDVTSWYGIVVRAGTPSEIVEKLQRDIALALKNPAVAGKITALGLEPVGNTPQQFAAMIKTETAKWSAIVDKAHIQPLD